MVSNNPFIEDLMVIVIGVRYFFSFLICRKFHARLRMLKKLSGNGNQTTNNIPIFSLQTCPPLAEAGRQTC
ncbi:MAG: hypothetical protein A3G49_06580 [Candidatus Sungbacteria bacterium RIFCSPLOWO2_12_FULL_41_11]|uniref:Uncharacterized protein n=1 Tax=Candidatus Sungbacteria bacterium RIFCSPLOWO2_12_FULL_41_11 TaxID=1802286 RepID=A0A1G2LSJ9_9BACT|nr:MAG: hypothetical protein A3D41_05015 [Candidatus Sungbacteria bacterium RIFCSPHIGHO2_02_FULL_41_12b]OHA14484.1 MAG: hypothetical protein A3G49_06580 [Candidatus Sungbacteria bacterium RIFCSPLOWO2_12_FULL_41_11]